MPANIDHIQRNFVPLMAQIARQWRRAIDRRLQPLGLTEATWLPLLRLARAPEPMRQKDLAAALSLDSSSVVRLLDELQSAGFIERRESADRRAKTIHLTERGRIIVEHVEAEAGAARRSILARVPDQELEAAFRVLEQISAALSSAARDGSA